MNPEIFEMISYLQLSGAQYISLATNAIPLINNQELKLKLKNSGINELIVSLSDSSQECLQTRGADVQSQLMNELSFFKNSSMTITGNFLIHQDNKEKLYSLFLNPQSEKSPLDLIRFLPYSKEYDVSPNPVFKEINKTEMSLLSKKINQHNGSYFWNRIKKAFSLTSNVDIVLIKPSKEESDIIFLSA